MSCSIHLSIDVSCVLSFLASVNLIDTPRGWRGHIKKRMGPSNLVNFLGGTERGHGRDTYRDMARVKYAIFLFFWG